MVAVRRDGGSRRAEGLASPGAQTDTNGASCRSCYFLRDTEHVPRGDQVHRGALPWLMKSVGRPSVKSCRLRGTRLSYACEYVRCPGASELGAAA